MMWTIAYGHHEDCTPTRGYEPTREAAMAAFAKSWPAAIDPRRHWRGRWPRRITRGDIGARIGLCAPTQKG
jgi:hypothetical protein